MKKNSPGFQFSSTRWSTHTEWPSTSDRHQAYGQYNTVLKRFTSPGTPKVYNFLTGTTDNTEQICLSSTFIKKKNIAINYFPVCFILDLVRQTSLIIVRTPIMAKFQINTVIPSVIGDLNPIFCNSFKYNAKIILTKSSKEHAPESSSNSANLESDHLFRLAPLFTKSLVKCSTEIVKRNQFHFVSQFPFSC